MNTLFLGTSLFAQKCLEHLVNDSQFKLQSVITRPPQKAHRGMKLQDSPVSLYAKENNIRLHAPSSFKNKDEIEFIKKLDIDVVIVVAYGVILPAYFLDWFPDRVVNIHTSLLPRWRGASPVTSCLLSGDLQTGVTLQKVSVKMDAGDIIHQLSFEVSPQMNSKDLLKKMEPLACQLLSKFLPLYLKGEITPQAQDQAQITLSKKIDKKELQIDWSQSSHIIHNQVRAFILHKGAYTFYKGLRLKVLQSVGDEKSVSTTPGQVMSFQENKGLQVACGKGSLWIQVVQLEGKKPQEILAFLRGFEIGVGSSFISSYNQESNDA